MGIWTIIDPPRETELAKLIETDGNTVEIYLKCVSNNAWYAGALSWEAAYIFCAAVLAFQSRKIRAEFNESREIGNMAYCHFLFLVFRFLIIVMQSTSSMKQNVGDGTYSFLLSADSLFVITLYFGPKFYVIIKHGDI